MKLKIKIHACYDSYNKQYRFVAFPHDMTSAGYIVLEEREIEFDPPPASVLDAGTIESYRKEQQRIRAEATVKVNNIQEQIDALLCIENKTTGD